MKRQPEEFDPPLFVDSFFASEEEKKNQGEEKTNEDPFALSETREFVIAGEALFFAVDSYFFFLYECFLVKAEIVVS